jgi:WD40 repeat protein/serine/threonine protein kinase
MEETVAGPGEGREEFLAAASIGPYRIMRRLGEGAQGTVYLAEDSRLPRQVALKVLPAHWMAQREALERFRREAIAASRLNHPCICTVYEANTETDPPYIALEYIDGRNLAELIREAQSGVAPAGSEVRSSVVVLPSQDSDSSVQLHPARISSSTGSLRVELERVCALVEGLARALHVAHEAGFIHRDIKPSNIMVTAHGRPVILDFGLARDMESSELTRTGTLIGTPVYMSPEQLRPDRQPLDQRTDVYSLGVVLYECLALRRPFDAPTLEALYHQILETEPTPLRRLNPIVVPDLAVVVETAMAKDPARRYRTALEFADELRRVQERLPIRARPIGPLLRLRRWAQRNRALAASLALLFVLLAGTAVTTTALLKETSSALRVAEQANRQTEIEYDAKVSALIRARAIALANTGRVELQRDPMLGLLLARESVRLAPIPAGVASLRAAIAAHREVLGKEYGRSFLQTVEFAPDGRSLLVASSDGSVHLVGLDGEVLTRVRSSSRGVRLATFSPDGTKFLAVARTPKAKVWDRSGKLLTELDGHPKGARGGDFAPDGKTIVTGGDDGVIRLWSVDGEALREFAAHDGVIRSVKFSPDGRRLLSAGVDGAVRVWDRSGRELLTMLHEKTVYDASYSLDGSLIASVSADLTIRIWDATGGERLRIPCTSSPKRVVFTPDGKHILVAMGWDCTARIWDLSGRAVDVFWGCRTSLLGIAISPDGALVAASTVHRALRIWRIRRPEIAALVGHTEGVRTARFGPSDERLVTASYDGSAALWDRDGRRLARFAFEGERIFTAELSPDGGEVLAASQGGRVHLLPVAGGGGVSFRVDPEECRWAVYSPDGESILTAGNDRKIHVWSRQGQPLRTLTGSRNWTTGAVMSRDRKTIAGAGWDESLRIWREGEEKPIVRHAHEDRLTGIAFSPDGAQLLTASADATAKLWSVDGEPLTTFRGHARTVLSARFSHDGTRVVTASMDRTVRIWSLDGQEVGIITGDVPYLWAEFSPSDRYIVTTPQIGPPQIHYAGVDDLLRLADERILRDFTDAERLRFAELLDPDAR